MNPEIIYLIIRWHYNMPFAHYTVEYTYFDQSKALQKCKELEEANDRPVEEDSYGPYSGTKYDVWPRVMDV